MDKTAEIEALRDALVKALAERDRTMGLLETAGRELVGICKNLAMSGGQVREQGLSLGTGMLGAAVAEKKRWCTP